ncbi:MAG: hypothetical protein ACP5O7_07790, partial [Phycisphaerae bacterium]
MMTNTRFATPRVAAGRDPALVNSRNKAPRRRLPNDFTVLVQPELDNQYRRLRYCRVRTVAFF